jgi:Helix-turn-helix domain
VDKDSSVKPSQTDRVLTALRNAGELGVHTFSLRREPPYIGNPSERVADLERRGHVITATRERLNGEAWGCRYRLTFDAGDLEPAVAPAAVPPVMAAHADAPTVPGSLFDIAPAAGQYETAA